MPPKARRSAPKAAAAAEETPVALPLKRGRPPKADAVEAAVEPPKKRGRPAKAKPEEAVVEDAPEPRKRGRQPKPAPESEPEPEPVVEEPVAVKKGRGRPKKEVAPAQQDAPVASRRGRPPKADVVAEAPPATPKRGRPARTTAIDLNRVAGSPRVGKRSSPRTKAKPEPVIRRLDPRVRSKLRTRLPPAKTIIAEKIVPKPTARRGRPPKNTAPASKQSAVAKPTKPAKPLAPRKVRGHTVRQIPDRYLAQVDKYLDELIDADKSPIDEEHVEIEVEEEVQEEDGVVAEDAAEDGQDALVSSEQDRDQYQEYSDDGGIDMDGQQDGAEEDEDMQAVLAQDGEEDDEELPDDVEFPNEINGDNQLPEDDAENAEPVQQVEMSVHEDVVVEDDEGIVHAELDAEIMVRKDNDDNGQDIFNDEDETELISGTPGPPAIAIFS